MNAGRVAEPTAMERLQQERNQYYGFLRITYRILHRYEQIHEIFQKSLDSTTTSDEKEHERRKLAEINTAIAALRTMILSAEKKNESNLFSD